MARKTEDLTGQKFGRLTAIGGYDRSTGITYWDFQCDCGNIKSIPARSVKNGAISSCGCLKSDVMRERNTSHGHSGRTGRSMVYSVWSAMVARCTNPNVPQWGDYGGRGIAVCDRWLRFENFLEDMGEPEKGMSIDRIDNSKGYCKENCRWATPKEQVGNRRNTLFLTVNGRTKTLAGWAEELGVDYDRMLQRKLKGWSDEDCVSVPFPPVATRRRFSSAEEREAYYASDFVEVK